MEKAKMSPIQILFTAVFLLLAILAILYGVTVYLVNSGSSFYVVWFGMGVCFLILAAMTLFRLFSKIPPAVRIIAIAICALGFLVFLYSQIRILGHFHDEGPKNLDYIIVLGAQMRGNSPSVVLKYRLDTAADYLKENPSTVCIVSGGQGKNEILPEAEGMKNYLVNTGIEPDRILTEDASKNTIENILFSKKLLPENSEPSALQIGIVTNNFHVYRGLALARKQGLTSTYGIAAPSTLTYLPNNMLREFVGITKDTLLRNMNCFSLF